MNSPTKTIRLTEKQIESINLLVSQGKYKDFTAFVRQAIDAMLRVEGL